MMTFGSLFSKGNKMKELIEQGATVIDVRTPAEFAGGNYKGSTNIPLDRITAELDALKKLKQPLVLVCRSGARSGQAASFLSQNGIDAHNGGSWDSL
jgi:phage shock protein E